MGLLMKNPIWKNHKLSITNKKNVIIFGFLPEKCPLNLGIDFEYDMYILKEGKSILLNKEEYNLLRSYKLSELFSFKEAIYKCISSQYKEISFKDITLLNHKNFMAYKLFRSDAILGRCFFKRLHINGQWGIFTLCLSPKLENLFFLPRFDKALEEHLNE